MTTAVPLGYYDELRNSTSNTTRDVRPDSTVVRVSLDDENDEDFDTIRLCQLNSILPLSAAVQGRPGVREPIDFRIGLEASGFLALTHLNQRSPQVLPHLPSLLSGCNVYWTVDYMDTRFSPIHASGTYHSTIVKSDTLPQVPRPAALIGAARSVVSASLSVLGGVYETPQISGTSTSATLDNKDSFPYFARTVPNNMGDAHAVARYLKSLGVSDFGIIYVRDDYGTFFHKDLVDRARELEMRVVSAPYEDDVEGSLNKAINTLRSSKFKYFFGIPNPSTYKTMLRAAYNAGIIGRSGYVWLLSESTLELVNPSFRLNATTERDLARAIHGVGVVVIDVPSNDKFDTALQQFGTNETLQQYYVSRHTEPELFNGHDFNMPGASLYQYLNYDAVIAMGLAACSAEKEFFTGPDLYQSLLTTKFEGVSGTVQFDLATGTRSTDNLLYVIQNVIAQMNETGDGYIYFSSQTAVAVDLSGSLSGSIQETRPYIYAGNPKELPPLALPPLEEDMNLIGTGLHVLGFTMAGIVMCMSVGWLIWTIWNRKKPVVRASQPIFLCKLCVGTFIMASSIIPMGLQEPISQRGLDIACMATPWLLSVGFVTSFSALFSKTWRLNRVFKMSQEFRRVDIQVNDVLRPFVILMFLNLTILTVWTIAAPLEWNRIDTGSRDEFGRLNESYGTCVELETTSQRVLVSCLAVVNVTPLLIATYQAYQARHIPPSNFNESTYIGISLASLLEAFILSIPILIVVQDVPSASFLMQTILVTIICLAIQLPLFVPKYIKRNERPQEYERRRAVRTSMYLGGEDGFRSSYVSSTSTTYGTTSRRTSRGFGRVRFASINTSRRRSSLMSQNVNSSRTSLQHANGSASSRSSAPYAYDSSSSRSSVGKSNR